jgi:hypothetical protein
MQVVRQMVKGILLGAAATFVVILLYGVWFVASLPIPKGAGVQWDIRNLSHVMRFFVGIAAGSCLVTGGLILGIHLFRTLLLNHAAKLMQH